MDSSAVASTTASASDESSSSVIGDGNMSIPAAMGAENSESTAGSSADEGFNSAASRNSNFPSCSPAPAVEVKLFVGRLPRSHTEEMIRPIFEQYGNVAEVVVIRDKQTQNHKGSAFVRMASICQADSAIRALNNVKVVDPALGTLTVKYATGEVENLGLPATAADPTSDQAKLFVGSLPKNVTDHQLRELFGRYGTVDEIFIMKDANGMPKGCAFVKVAYKEQAIFAVNQLNGKFTMQGASRPVEVRFAAPRRPPGERGPDGVGGVGGYVGGPQMMVGGGYGSANSMGGNRGMGGGSSNAAPRQCGSWKEYFSSEGRPYYHNEHTGATQWERPPEFDDHMMGGGGYMGGGMGQGMGGGGMSGGQEATGPPGANIFVFHIPNEWTQQDLFNNFSPFGNIISGRIAQDRQTGRNRGFAFVSYDNADSASTAVNNMNGFLACGKRLKVTIKKGEEGSQASGGGAGVGMPAGGQMNMMQQAVNAMQVMGASAWLAG